MTIYLLIFLFFFILVIHFDVNQGKSGRYFFFGLEAVILILLFGLRYRVGGDSLIYEDNWENMPTLSELQRDNAFQYLSKQPLYYIFVAVIKEFGGNFISFQIIHAVIVNLFFFKIIKKYCKHIFTAVLLYFFFMSFNSNTEILRETLAVVIFLYSLDYLLAHKWVHYFVFCLIALNIHISAIICFLLPLFFKFCIKKWEIKRQIQVALLFGVVAFVYIRYVPSLLTTLSLWSLLNSTNMDKMEIYVNMLGYSNINGYIFYIVNVSIILFFSYVMKNNGLTNPIQNLAINMTFVFTIVNIFMPIVGSRWAGYFSLLYYICIADLLYTFPSKYSILKPITIFFILFVVGTKIHSQLSPDPWSPAKVPTYVRYIPYHSVFDKKKEYDREASTREIYDI